MRVGKYCEKQKVSQFLSYPLCHPGAIRTIGFLRTKVAAAMFTKLTSWHRHRDLIESLQ